jgi:hypothetical protein
VSCQDIKIKNIQILIKAHGGGKGKKKKGPGVFDCLPGVLIYEI